MNATTSRRGSALLIVLGMLSFMLVSAVGFAAYMRYVRLPSSYLRRSSSSRQLVKAALAKAIDTIDLAINNNPHPNVGDNQAIRMPWTGAGPRNKWTGRVFIGTDDAPDNTSADATPLCVEALAYIPPSLINEIRYYSRHTPTAKWQTLGFDSGRYV